MPKLNKMCRRAKFQLQFSLNVLFNKGNVSVVVLYVLGHLCTFAKELV